jgi:hypothetical protein
LDRSIIHVAQYLFSSVSHSSSLVLSFFRSVIHFCSSALLVLLFSVRSFFVSHYFSFFIFQIRFFHFSLVFVISLYSLILSVFPFMFITLFSALPLQFTLFSFKFFLQLSLFILSLWFSVILFFVYVHLLSPLYLSVLISPVPFPNFFSWIFSVYQSLNFLVLICVSLIFSVLIIWSSAATFRRKLR